MIAGTLSDTDLVTFKTKLRDIDDEWFKYKFLLGEKYDRTNLASETKFLRSIFYFSNPITWEGKVYKTSYDDEDTQEKKVTDFTVDLDDEFKKDNEDAFEVFIFNSAFFDIKFGEILFKDLNYAVISIVLVFCYMWFSLRSFWMTFNAMLNIVVSFPITLVIYRGIF